MSFKRAFYLLVRRKFDLKASLYIVFSRGILVLVAMQFAVSYSVAQVRVTAIWKDGQSLEKTEDVRCRRDNLSDEGIYVKMVLKPFDELTSPSGLVWLELDGPNGSIFRGSDKFKIIVFPSSKADMVLNVLSGNGEMASAAGAVMTSGDVSIVVVKTEYAVRVRHTKDGPVREFLTFEGEVVVDTKRFGEPIFAGRKRLRPSPFGTTIPTGKKILLDNATLNPEVTTINSEDIAKSASVYAHLDTAKAMKRNVDPEATYAGLLSRYKAIFQNPTNADNRLQLAIDQVNLEVNQGALYQLKKAEQFTPTSQRKSRAVIAVTKAVAFAQSGNRLAAETEIQKARTLDSSVLEEGNLRTYRLNEKARQEVLQFKPVAILPGQDPFTLRAWPIPGNLTFQQQQVFKFIHEGNFAAASRLLKSPTRIVRSQTSIDAYATAIIYYELKEPSKANNAAGLTLKKAITDNLLPKDVQDATTRILLLTRQQ